MKKLLLLLVLIVSSLGTDGQIIIVNGCNGSGDNINGPYYLTGTDGNGRNIYQANYYHSLCAFTSDCRPQVISYGPYNDETGWHIKTGRYQVLAYSNEPGNENPPATGWQQQSYSGTCTAMTISYPETVESKNCVNCLWSDPDTWVTGTVPTANDHVIINGNIVLDIDASILNLDIKAGKSVENINNKSIVVKGKYDNQGFLKAYMLTLQGYIIPQTVDGTRLEIQEFRVDNVGGVTLTGNLEVLKSEVSSVNNVTLNTGNIFLGDYDLICHGLAGGAAARVVTNGGGSLKYRLPGGAIDKTFPVALALAPPAAPNSTVNYFPIVIQGTANQDNELPVTISVNVDDFNTSRAVPENAKNINAEWNISSNHESIQTPFTITFGWTAWDYSAMPSDFQPNNIYVKRWNGTNWENKTGPANFFALPGVGWGINAENITEFSTWAIFDSETVLPVTLASFDVKSENGTAHLTWETTEESNSSHFEIEHSPDARTWKQVGQVRSAGESRELARYSFNHGSPVKARNYYRLKIVDADGSYTYSSIKALFFNSAANEEIYLYPNPVAGRLYLKDRVSEISSLSVISQSGQKMISDIPYSEKGISLEALPAGTYLVNIELNDGSRISRKLLIGK